MKQWAVGGQCAAELNGGGSGLGRVYCSAPPAPLAAAKPAVSLSFNASDYAPLHFRLPRWALSFCPGPLGRSDDVIGPFVVSFYALPACSIAHDTYNTHNTLIDTHTYI